MVWLPLRRTKTILIIHLTINRHIMAHPIVDHLITAGLTIHHMMISPTVQSTRYVIIHFALV